MERTKDKFMRMVQVPFWETNLNPITMWVMEEPYFNEKLQARRDRHLDNN